LQDNRIILAGGANHKLTVDILKQYEEVLKESDMILLQNEIPFEVNDYVLHTYCSSARILYNAAPAMEIDRSLYPRIHTLIINQSECEYLLRSEIKDQSDAMNAAKTFSDLGVKNVVVTLGKRGAAFCDGVQTGHVGIIQVQAVDTTGAGDSFCAGVAEAVLHGERLEEAVKFATKVAALSVMKKGAQNSMPFLKQVMDQ
jgi:ribokinase